MTPSGPVSLALLYDPRVRPLNWAERGVLHHVSLLAGVSPDGRTVHLERRTGEAETLGGRRRPVPTGFAALDGDAHGVGHFAGGLHRGELVVTADQGGGKTAWVLQVALHAARQGLSVLVISQEMSAEALHWRLASADAKVDSGALRSGRLTQGQLDALLAASNAYTKRPARGRPPGA